MISVPHWPRSLGATYDARKFPSLKKGYVRRLVKRLRNAEEAEKESEAKEATADFPTRAFRRTIYGYYVEGRVCGFSPASRDNNHKYFVHMRYPRERKATIGCRYVAGEAHDSDDEEQVMEMGVTMPCLPIHGGKYGGLQLGGNMGDNNDKHSRNDQGGEKGKGGAEKRGQSLDDGKMERRKQLPAMKANGISPANEEDGKDDVKEECCSSSSSSSGVTNSASTSPHSPPKEYYLLNPKRSSLREGATVLCAFRRMRASPFARSVEQRSFEHFWIRGEVTAFNGTFFRVRYDDDVSFIDTEEGDDPLATSPVEYMVSACLENVTPRKYSSSTLPFVPADVDLSEEHPTLPGALPVVVVVDGGGGGDKNKGNAGLTPKERWPRNWLDAKFHFGEAVWARWNGNLFYRGTVHAMNANGTYHIMFDDGDEQAETPPCWMLRNRPPPHRTELGLDALDARQRAQAEREDDNVHGRDPPVYTDVNPIADAEDEQQ
eukprot:jgi/Bigna1/88003/estExt_fgenesh1_pg.C_270022